jgi:uncharacterized protein
MGELAVRAAENAARATDLLRRFLREIPDDDRLLDEIRECEDLGDDITHELILELNQHRRRRRPFGLSDGHALASAIDDVVDYAEETAELIRVYRVEASMEQAEAMADVLADASAVSARAVRALVEDEALDRHLVEIHRLENEGDDLERRALGALFSGGIDPMVVVRWKDIFATLEQAIDACENVAHQLEGIALKRAS